MNANELIRHMVSIPGSEENSDFMVDASSPEQAADLYVQAIVDERISVIASELFDARWVVVTTSPGVGHDARVVNWEETVETPVSVEDIPAFTSAVARGWNRNGDFEQPEVDAEMEI